MAYAGLYYGLYRLQFDLCFSIHYLLDYFRVKFAFARNSI